MAGVLVGSDDCPIPEIVKIFLKPPMDVIMIDKWTRFADALQLPYAFVKQLHKKLTLDQIEYHDIVNELLYNWLSLTGENATVGNLINIVKENFDWELVIGFLRTKIQQNAKTWEDLDDTSKNDMLNYEVQFLGNKQTLISIRSRMKDDDFMSVLKEHFDRDFIQQTLNKRNIVLDQSALPRQLPYYINRTLTWKRRLDPIIFRETCSDIFVFEGIQRHQLTLLAKPNLTDISGGQIHNLNVRFIFLECEHDFKEILKQAKVPVHRIKCIEDFFYWTFTAGSLRLIRSFLTDDEPEKISEQLLVKEHLTMFSSRPLTIVSSPGMGKSVLLGSLAHEVHAEFPERIVLFLEMRSFIQQQKSILKAQSLPVIKDFMASFISECVFGQKIIRKLLDDEEKQFEVFFDGFDEIPLDQIRFAKEFFTCLLESKNIRAHITSRPHMRDGLEDTIDVISFDITAFQVNDQIDFLTGFWKNQLEIQNKEKLSSFAIAIQEISSDFVGIPFQCFLLAQIYSKEVQRFSSFDTDFYQITNPSKSLFDLYNKFFEMRFENVSHEDRDYIRNYHWVEAMKLLFSSDVLAIRIHEILEAEICERFSSPDRIYEYGILQAGRAVNCPVFVHRTLAEFLVGDMIVEYFRGNHLSHCEIMVPFILETILATCTDIEEMDLNTDERFEWVANTIKIICECENGSKLELRSRLLSAFLPDLTIPAKEFDESPIEMFIKYWMTVNGTHATYGALVRILNNQDLFEIVDGLQKTAYTCAQDFTFVNNMVCFFLDANLARYEDNINERSHVIMHFNQLKQNKDAQLFEDGFKQVHLLTKKCFKHLLARIAPLLWDKRDSPLKIPDCQELLNCAASSGDVEIFQNCCGIVDKVGETKFAEIRFKKQIYKGTEYEHTPLHCSVGRGNYKLSEYLISSYEDKLVDMQFLYEYTLKDSSEDSPDKIKDKINILKLLKSINVSFDVKSPIEIPISKGIHTELFISFANIIGFTPKKGDENFLRDCVGSCIKNDLQLNVFVDWLVSNDQPRFLMLIRYTISELLLWNNLLPDTLAKIYKLCPLHLGVFLHSALNCERGEEFVKLIVNISGNVNITDSRKCTMLHWAAWVKIQT